MRTSRIAIDGGYGSVAVRGPYSTDQDAIAIDIKTIDRDNFKPGEAGLPLSVSEATALAAALVQAIAKAMPR